MAVQQLYQILIRRGATVPTLAPNELFYETVNGELWVGTSVGNLRLTQRAFTRDLETLIELGIYDANLSTVDLDMNVCPFVLEF